jgi:endogenous inhibitor of DNA gyrase (YacG/DUF329 family)
MEGHSTADWPRFPFCSERCRLIDLGRWLDDKAYRIGPQAKGEPAEPAVEDDDIP